jgi:hypothetical protein
MQGSIGDGMDRWQGKNQNNMEMGPDAKEIDLEQSWKLEIDIQKARQRFVKQLGTLLINVN